MLGGQLLLLLSYVLIFSVALSFVAIGGMFSERSGVINIGLEGTMVFGGFMGMITMTGLQATPLNTIGFGKFIIVLLTLIVAIVSGMLYSLLLAFAAINFNADQTLVGTAMNLLATAVAVIFTKVIHNGISSDIVFDKSLFTYGSGAFSISLFFFLSLLIIPAAVIVLYKTRFGLRLRACGENPNAADSVGINVKKYRYAGVLISGALGGLGAIAYLIPTQNTWATTSGVAGFGFLALAIMIFGQWKPIKITIVSVIFSLLLAFSYVYNGLIQAIFGTVLTAAQGVTPELFRILPYLASLILLIFGSKNSRAPKAEGKPYDVSKR